MKEEEAGNGKNAKKESSSIEKLNALSKDSKVVNSYKNSSGETSP
jgi:hypothetical protein